jgi:hypothetical protein
MNTRSSCVLGTSVERPTSSIQKLFTFYNFVWTLLSYALSISSRVKLVVLLHYCHLKQGLRETSRTPESDHLDARRNVQESSRLHIVVATSPQRAWA